MPKKITIEIKPAKIVIRKVRIDDVKFVADLSIQLGHELTEKEAAERVSKIMKDRNQAIFVAEHVGERILGYAYVMFVYELANGYQARLEGLVTDENARGLGIGRKLMEQVEKWAKKKGSKTMKFVSNIKRVEAHGFYEEIGYEKSKVQQQFKKEL